MKKILLSMLLGLLLLTGCGKVPVLSNGKEAVISLDEDGISVDELYEEMKDKYALSVLIDMMDRKILDKKYPETDEEKKYANDYVEQAHTYYDYLYSQRYSTYELYLINEIGVTSDDELKEQAALNFKRNKAVEDYAKSLVTDKEIEAYYEEKTYGNIEASHILITADVNSDATDEEKEEADKKALDLAKELIARLNNGEDFATLAKEYSKDGSAANGGALGEFGRDGMDEDFYEAAVKLEVGAYSKEPVKTQFGYHIILKTNQKEKPKLEEVKDEIIETLAEEKTIEDSRISNKALIQLREDHGLNIEDSNLKKQYENYVYNATNN